MHWTAFGFGLGIAAYFGVPREPGPLVFLAASLSAGLCVGLAIRFRTGIARVLIVIAALAGGFAWSQFRAHAVSGPVLSERFYGAVQGWVIGIDRSLSEKPRLTLDQLVLGALQQHVTPNRLRVALHGIAQDSLHQIGDIVQLAAHLAPPPGPAEPYCHDFQRQAWFARLGAVGYTGSPVVLWRAAPVEREGLTVQKWRRRIGAHIVAHMPARSAGVAVAITVGDRMYLDRDVHQTLRAANLSHLLAISGLHMGLLTSRGFFFFASSYVLPSRSDLKLANQENRGIDQHGSGGGISTAVWGQCCIRACIYYGLYHLRSRAVRVAPGHVVSAFNSGNFGFTPFFFQLLKFRLLSPLVYLFGMEV